MIFLADVNKTVVPKVIVLNTVDKCKERISKAEAMLQDSGSDGVYARLKRVITDMRGRMRSDGQVVMMGYPYLINANCSFIKDGYDVSAKIMALTRSADEIQGRLAQELNATSGPSVKFLPVSPQFYNHGPKPYASGSLPSCPKNPNGSWIEGSSDLSVGRSS